MSSKVSGKDVAKYGEKIMKVEFSISSHCSTNFDVETHYQHEI